MTGAVKPLNDQQRQGASPGHSAWVTASAGTGKTQVLTSRILRLLLDGVEPAAILAITFTKAAAAEMASRIREKLASWVTLADAALSKELWAIGAPGYDRPEHLRFARTLFARVIDAPGSGLAIQTIHSFCQTLLAAFPEEAGLAPGFRPLEEEETRLLLRDTLMQCMAQAPQRGDLGFVDRVNALALLRGEAGARDYLYQCAQSAETLERLPVALRRWMREQFGLPQQGSPSEWVVAQCANDGAHLAHLADAAKVLATWKSKTGSDGVRRIGEWLSSSAADRAASLDALVEVFVKKGDGKLRSHFDSDKQCADAHEAAMAASRWLVWVRDTAAQMDLADGRADALDAGRHFARAYDDRKRRDGLVDFDDLIARTAKLLGQADDREWIKYKLDQRVDHLLLDEAQDTNARQWAIVRGLVEEYFSGAGAKGDVPRTMFVVGDAKQAIYGFQGTSPMFFSASRGHYAELASAAEHPWSDLSIDVNFRSSPPVLAVVDRVIAALGNGVTDDPVRHHAFADDAPGRVVLWPPEPATEAGEAVEGGEGEDGGESGEEDGGANGGESMLDGGSLRVADKIARTVRQWLDQGIEGEAVAPGDVLILCRKRSQLAQQIVSRLQLRKVPVAGVDRLGLNAPLAVQDIMAAARFALQPLDSLNLASLLVSPIMGWSHDDVISFGWRAGDDGQESMPLWPHLNRQDALRPRLEPLYAILAMAGYLGPYRFFEQLLSGPVGARARLLARLGVDSLDPIEELLNQAIAFETRQGGSLHQFVRWFDSGDQMIKRELDAPLGEVRVMTVHGSKGLQGKIVILADAAADPAQSRPDSTFAWPYDDGKVPILPIAKKAGPPQPYKDEAEHQSAEELREHSRLLYVAMTRAERMLFVAGALNNKPHQGRLGKVPENCWYLEIENALNDMGASKAEDAIWASSLTYARGGKVKRIGKAPSQTGLDAPTLPGWVRRSPPAEARPRKPLSPSTNDDVAVLAIPQPPSADAGVAQRRGILIHALFERLPAVAANARASVAARWLASQAPEISESDRARMIADVLSVTDNCDYSELFGPDSLAEVPFSALVDGRVIAGTVDRLRVTDDRVDIIDFKSGAFVPVDEAMVQPAYLRQMAAYVAAMEVIFPGRRVGAALLFSAEPRLIHLSEAAIAANKPMLAQG